MPSVTRCAACGTPRDPESVACQRCGSEAVNVDVVLDAVGGEYVIAGEAVSAVSEGSDLDGQGRRVEANLATGARSVAVLRPEGTVRLDVQPPVDVGGRRNESRTCDTLVAAMQASGVPVTGWRPGVDPDGEDGVLRIADHDVPVQIVTVPPHESFWRGVHAGSGTTLVTWDAAASGWLHHALADKAGSLADARQRANTLVVLDATHAGVLVQPEIVRSYLSQYPAPRAEFGFAGAWVVGPTLSCTTRLGEGSW
jgi:hypothetical protein